MTDPSTMPETPDVAATTGFLRRFADMMSTGYNAAYLRRAAELLETLTSRVAATSDEAELWRYKYETATHQVEVLEAECEGLKQDIEGHLEVTSSLLIERDGLRAGLEGRESELSELQAAQGREREAHESALAAGSEELEQLRRAHERAHEDDAAKLQARETELSELRVAFARERAELQVQLKVRSDELAALRTVSEREQESLRAKVASLGDKRVELRAAFDRINSLRHQTIEHPSAAASSGGAESEPQADSLAVFGRAGVAAVGDSNAVVPKTTLRQARAQFEYLAREFIPLGDIASQVMCELGAYTMDLALVAGQSSDHLPVGEVALNILSTASPASPAAGERL
jgi:hypothetical protein